MSRALSFPVGVPILVLLQSMALGRAIRRAAYWAIGGLLGMVAGGGAVAALFIALGGDFGAAGPTDPRGPWLGLLLGAAFGLLFGLCKGVALAWIMGKASSEKKSAG